MTDSTSRRRSRRRRRRRSAAAPSPSAATPRRRRTRRARRRCRRRSRHRSPRWTPLASSTSRAHRVSTRGQAPAAAESAAAESAAAEPAAAEQRQLASRRAVASCPRELRELPRAEPSCPTCMRVLESKKTRYHWTLVAHSASPERTGVGAELQRRRRRCGRRRRLRGRRRLRDRAGAGAGSGSGSGAGAGASSTAGAGSRRRAGRGRRRGRACFLGAAAVKLRAAAFFFFCAVPAALRSAAALVSAAHVPRRAARAAFRPIEMRLDVVTILLAGSDRLRMRNHETVDGGREGQHGERRSFMARSQPISDGRCNWQQSQKFSVASKNATAMPLSAWSRCADVIAEYPAGASELANALPSSPDRRASASRRHAGSGSAAAPACGANLDKAAAVASDIRRTHPQAQILNSMRPRIAGERLAVCGGFS